ncbi:hypothetical protein ACQEU3_46650 [Spirillospora sp. CA-253888]
MQNRTGWTYGTLSTDGHWLTVPGAAHQRPTLHPTRDAATTALNESGWLDNPHTTTVTAHVEQVDQTAFRVIEH